MKKTTLLASFLFLAIGVAIGYGIARGSIETGQAAALEPPENYTGVWKIKDAQGRLIEIKTYANGQLHGPHIKWYNSGPLHWVYNFNNGEPQGRQVTFGKQGEILNSSVK